MAAAMPFLSGAPLKSRTDPLSARQRCSNKEMRAFAACECSQEFEIDV